MGAVRVCLRALLYFVLVKRMIPQQKMLMKIREQGYYK